MYIEKILLFSYRMFIGEVLHIVLDLEICSEDVISDGINVATLIKRLPDGEQTIVDLIIVTFQNSPFALKLKVRFLVVRRWVLLLFFPTRFYCAKNVL